MNRRLLVLMFFLIPQVLSARIVRTWSYQEMFDKADLVVIASVVSTKDTKERTTLLNDVNVVGVFTEFKSLLILKGPKTVPTFQLRHYRLQSENDEKIVNGPDLVRIGPHHPVFLLFLTKDRDGRYSPLTGQTDPATFSVLRLNGAAE
jgi:hypothetical protein